MQPTDEPPSTPDRARDRLMLRLLLSLISLVLTGMGLLAVITAHYYGHSSRHGNVEVTLDGLQAVLMGLTEIFFGLMPLGAWFSTKRGVLCWMLGCVALAAAAFVTLLHES